MGLFEADLTLEGELQMFFEPSEKRTRDKFEQFTCQEYGFLFMILYSMSLPFIQNLIEMKFHRKSFDEFQNNTFEHHITAERTEHILTCKC